MFVPCSNWSIQVGDPIIPLWKKLKFTAHPSLKCLTCAQYKHEPKVKTCDKMGECSDYGSQVAISLVSNWMFDHLGSIHLVFFHFGYDCRNIRQICQILLINLNFRKTWNLRAQRWASALASAIVSFATLCEYHQISMIPISSETQTQTITVKWALIHYLVQDLITSE